jgi:hypothetical protein
MYVEHDILLRAIFASLQRPRSLFGTSVRMAPTKSALMTMASVR